jgi:hypothetical protein
MASVLQVETIKDSGGNANAIEIANSSANVTINQLTATTGFPAGHVIKRYSQTRTSGGASINHDITTSWTKISLGGNFDIAGVTATQNNILRMTLGNLNWHVDDDNTYQTSLAITTDGTSVGAANLLAHWGGYNNDATQNWNNCFMWECTVPANFSNKTISVVTRKQTGAPGGQWSWNLQQNANVTGAHSTAFFSVEEIQV